MMNIQDLASSTRMIPIQSTKTAISLALLAPKEDAALTDDRDRKFASCVVEKSCQWGYREEFLARYMV
jgi:hypothetical protein